MIRACLFLCFLWACAWFFVMTFSLRMTVGAGQLTTSSEVFLMEYASNGKDALDKLENHLNKEAHDQH